MLVLTASEVVVRAFRAFSGLPNNHNGVVTEGDIKLFRKHFGASPTTIASLWCDLISHKEMINMPEKDDTERGFKKFLIAVHFLWAYPKNGDILATAFQVNLRQVQGENLWVWVHRIAALKALKIVWPTAEYQDPNRQVFIVSD